MHNEKIIGEINEAAKRKIHVQIESSNADLKMSAFSNAFNTAKEAALDEVRSLFDLKMKTLS